jgi:hypothetical protein
MLACRRCAAAGRRYTPRMPKRPKQKRWRVYRLRGKRMVELGHVEARDEAEAVARAIEEFQIPGPLHNRVLVRLED